MIKKVKKSCNLKQFCADNNLEADKIFVSYHDTSMPPFHSLTVTDVIVQFKGDNKVNVCTYNNKHNIIILFLLYHVPTESIHWPFCSEARNSRS